MASRPQGSAGKAPRKRKPSVRSEAKPRRGASRRLGTRILRSPFVQETVAGLAANYLRFVNLTSPLAFDPAGPLREYIHLAPVIFTMWHGQHFMLPFASIFDFDVRVLISRHHDGEINARVGEEARRAARSAARPRATPRACSRKAAWSASSR